ncbi:hypothetical protein [uncultured Maricaulis sp.]|uniref:hypothetical protein n=1 Tax=uncultured Maricaulis sp. TaxID=174710 RepID=UPI0025DAF3CF|nr:hypothetical protein [uncultured Maricaulis sp.]
MLTLDLLAEILEGDVEGNLVIAPAPGLKPTDRSLVVALKPPPFGEIRIDTLGLIDRRTCQNHVQRRLTLYAMRGETDGHETRS